MALELVNAVALSFAVSELLLGDDIAAAMGATMSAKAAASGSERFRTRARRWAPYAAALALVNLVLHPHPRLDALFATAILAPIAYMRAAVLSATHALSAAALLLVSTGAGFGAAALFALLFTVVASLASAGVAIRRDAVLRTAGFEASRTSWRIPAWLPIAALLVFVATTGVVHRTQLLEAAPVYGEPDAPIAPEARDEHARSSHHPELLRTALIFCAFMVLTFADARRCVGSAFGPHAFAFEAARAMPIVLPLFPALTVAIGALFLILVRVFEALHADTALLNAPIYYGALYGPCFALYFQVKRQLCYSRVLPR